MGSIKQKSVTFIHSVASNDSDNEGHYQTAGLCSLIWVFTVRICPGGHLYYLLFINAVVSIPYGFFFSFLGGIIKTICEEL